MFFFVLSGVSVGCLIAFAQSPWYSSLCQCKLGHSDIKWIAFPSASRQNRQSVSHSSVFQRLKWRLKGPCPVMSCMTLATVLWFKSLHIQGCCCYSTSEEIPPSTESAQCLSVGFWEFSYFAVVLGIWVGCILVVARRASKLSFFHFLEVVVCVLPWPCSLWFEWFSFVYHWDLPCMGIV